MTTIAGLLMICVAAPAVLSCAYLGFFTLLSGRPQKPRLDHRTLRFDLIVPAHNEASIIGRTIASLQDVDWPHDRYRVLVVADNCTDATAEVARAAGATVLVRQDAANRGKGYALLHAFNASRDAQRADAVVVVDADSAVSRNLLEAFAARIEAGSDAVQAHYGVRNPTASWRTRLMTIATGSFHIVRSRARERLRLSCGIRGNGWCVTHRLLQRVPYNSFSLAEDVEYGITIGLAGYRVAYCDEAHANADMVMSEDIARRQRQRWEDGRMALLRSKTPVLLTQALTRRSALCFDLGLDLLILPLSYVAMNVILLAALAGFGFWLHFSSALFLWIALACFAALAAYVLRGWRLSGIGIQGFWDLCRVPWFLVWKILLAFRRRDPKEWVRTKRESH